MHKHFHIFSLLDSAQRVSACKLLFLMVIGMLLEMLGVGLVVPIIVLLADPDPFGKIPDFFQPVPDWLLESSQEQLLTGTLILLVGAYLLKSAFLSYLAWKRARFAFNLQAQLAVRLFSIYLAQPYEFHLNQNSAQLIRNASSELNVCTTYVIIPSLQLIAEGLVILGLSWLLVLVEPVGTLLVMSVLTILAGIFHMLMKHRVSTWGRQRQHHEGLRIQHLQQSLGSIKELKLMGRENDFIRQFNVDVKASTLAGQKQAALQQIPSLWLELFGVLGLVILVLTMLKLGHSPQSLLPTLGLFAAAAFRLMPSANRILGALQQLRFGFSTAELLQKELNLTPFAPVKIDSKQRLSFSNSITFENVCFTYEDAHEPAIQNVSLCINRGDSIGLVGTSGSGKSTLIDLLLGLIEPEAGKILIDSQDIRDVTRGWQNIVGYVPQMIYLTDDTFKRNIALGIPDDEIDKDAVISALHAAQLDEWVSGLPKGLDTMVGERGVRLSGGQRQRVGIARALYHNPDVLVLDEATSALDNETEKEVMRAVSALRGEKTLIMVAHRTTTLTQCDHIFRLENGHLGNPEMPNDNKKKEL